MGRRFCIGAFTNTDRKVRKVYRLVVLKEINVIRWVESKIYISAYDLQWGKFYPLNRNAKMVWFRVEILRVKLQTRANQDANAVTCVRNDVRDVSNNHRACSVH